MDIRPTSEAALDYLWFGRNCLEHARQTGMPGAKALRDGRLIVICTYTLDHATLLTLSQGDFAMHPRSGTVAKLPYYDNEMNLYTLTGINGGGYAMGDGEFSELATCWIYPLKDWDRGTFLITIDNEEMEVEWAGKDAENYGNIWWVGQGDNPPVLSWRGPPSVQFSISGDYTIPGLSQVERTSNGKEYYTVFGCSIYRDGAVLCHGPQWFSDDEVATLVVGACYSVDTAGEEWLVAVTITRKGAGSFVMQVWRSSDAGVKWGLLSEFAATGRARVPAFIDPAGKAFVYDGTLYQIDSTVSSVSSTMEVMPETPAGTQTIDGTGGYESNYEYHGKGYCWPAMSVDGKLEYSSFSANARFISDGNGATAPRITTVPVYRGNPATEVTITAYREGDMVAPCTVTGDGTRILFAAEANGSFCKAVWSGVNCSRGLQAVKLVPECNADISVTVTLQPQGISHTYTQEQQTADIAVSGPANATVGAQYVAENAVGPVAWSISKGMISSSGVITDLTNVCGTITITATDVCGRTASKAVGAPVGTWVQCTYLYPGANGYSIDNETYTRYVTQIYNYCGNFESLAAVQTWAQGILVEQYSPDTDGVYWTGILFMSWTQECHDNSPTQTIWVGFYKDVDKTKLCDGETCDNHTT